MKRTSPKLKYSVGELVAVAYQEAERATHNRMLAALIARKILEDCLASSDRPDLGKQLLRYK